MVQSKSLTGSDSTSSLLLWSPATLSISSCLPLTCSPAELLQNSKDCITLARRRARKTSWALFCDHTALRVLAGSREGQDFYLFLFFNRRFKTEQRRKVQSIYKGCLLWVPVMQWERGSIERSQTCHLSWDGKHHYQLWLLVQRHRRKTAPSLKHSGYPYLHLPDPFPATDA